MDDQGRVLGTPSVDTADNKYLPIEEVGKNSVVTNQTADDNKSGKWTWNSDTIWVHIYNNGKKVESGAKATSFSRRLLLPAMRSPMSTSPRTTSSWLS